MKLLPPNVEQQIARVDRQKSLAIAIGSGLTALWCTYRVVWALYLAVSYDFLFGSLIFSVVLWGVIGTVAAVAAIAFYTQYSKGPAGETTDHPNQV